MNTPDPLYHPVSPVPAATLPGLAGDQALGVELGVTARRSAIAGHSDRRRATRPGPGRAAGARWHRTRAAAPCLRATRSDRPDRSAKPAGWEALTAAPVRPRPARPVMNRLQAVNGVAGPRRTARSGFRSGEVGRDRVGGVAVQAVPGMVVPAGGAGVLVPGVILDIAECGASVEREGDRRVPQAV